MPVYINRGYAIVDSTWKNGREVYGSTIFSNAGYWYPKKKKTRNSRMNGWIDGGGDSVN